MGSLPVKPAHEKGLNSNVFGEITISYVLLPLYFPGIFGLMMNLTNKSVTTGMGKKMMQICEELNINGWQQVKPRVANELSSFILMLEWLRDMRQKNEIDAEQARIHVDIQKNTMRTRLMAMPGIDMLTAENLMNKSIDGIRKDIFEYLGWVVV